MVKSFSVIGMKSARDARSVEEALYGSGVVLYAQADSESGDAKVLLPDGAVDEEILFSAVRKSGCLLATHGTRLPGARVRGLRAPTRALLTAILILVSECLRLALPDLSPLFPAAFALPRPLLQTAAAIPVVPILFFLYRQLFKIVLAEPAGSVFRPAGVYAGTAILGLFCAPVFGAPPAVFGLPLFLRSVREMSAGNGRAFPRRTAIKNNAKRAKKDGVSPSPRPGTDAVKPGKKRASEDEAPRGFAVAAAALVPAVFALVLFAGKDFRAAFRAAYFLLLFFCIAGLFFRRKR